MEDTAWNRSVVDVNDYYDDNPDFPVSTLIAVLNHVRRVPELEPRNRVKILLRASEALQRMAAEETQLQIRANQVDKKTGWNLAISAGIWGITRQAMAQRWKRWSGATN